MCFLDKVTKIHFILPYPLWLEGECPKSKDGKERVAGSKQDGKEQREGSDKTVILGYTKRRLLKPLIVILSKLAISGL